MAKKWIFWLLGGLWLLVVLLALSWRLGLTGEATEVTATPSPPPPTPTADELLVNVPLTNYDGPVSAPVKLVVFSDFDCFFCKAWHTRELRAALKAEFGDQLAIVFRHYPINSEGSWTVAEASQCAADQGKFWQFHDAWFDQHVPEEITEEEIVSIAAAIELDMTTWQTCRDSGQFALYVQQDLRLAQTTGYPEPPVFFVNGQRVIFKVSAQIDAIQKALLFTCPEGQTCTSGNE